MPLEKRQDITLTSTINVIETVEAIVTVWLPSGAQPAAQPTKPNPAPVVHVTPVQDAVVHTPTSPPPTRQDSQQATQDQVNQAQEQKNKAQAAQNQAAQEQSIAAQNQVNQAQEQANNDKTAQNQAVPAPVAQSSPVPVSTSAVAPLPSAPAPAPATQGSTSSGQTQSTSGSSCGEVGGACSAANVTYFGGGMGACGWSNDTNSEDFFALAHGALPLSVFNCPYIAESPLTLPSCRNDGYAVERKSLLWSHSGHRLPGQDYPWNSDRQMHGLRKSIPFDPSGWYRNLTERFI